MKIRFQTEDWREQLDGIELEADDIDDAADALSNAVIARLKDDGFTVQPAYGQSRGTHVIFQSGTDDEKAVFDSAVDAELRNLVNP